MKKPKRPCPFCGTRLRLTADHHGEYYEHPSNGCYESVAQLLDDRDVELWDIRDLSLGTVLHFGDKDND